MRITDTWIDAEIIFVLGFYSQVQVHTQIIRAGDALLPIHIIDILASVPIKTKTIIRFFVTAALIEIGPKVPGTIPVNVYRIGSSLTRSRVDSIILCDRILLDVVREIETLPGLRKHFVLVHEQTETVIKSYFQIGIAGNYI